MRIMKLCMSVLVLSFALFVSGTLAAQTAHLSFDGGIGIFNPCNGLLVSVNGPDNIDYHQNSDANGGTHVFVHMRFDGSGKDSAGNPFTASFNTNSHFDTLVSSYDVPFHSAWTGQTAGSSFSMDGIVRVSVADGAAIGSRIVQVTTSCNNDSQ
jgi:hypothetical protein